MKKIKLGEIVSRIGLLILAIFVAVFSPLLKFSDSDDMTFLYSTFIGKKSEYNGVLEVWNIDSFESGIKSKTSFLEMTAKRFQMENKGVYVIVRNLTENEMINLLNDKQVPDVISCSYGVANNIKEYVTGFATIPENLPSNFLNAGKLKNGEVYALPWCVGFYSLISTKAKLQKAGKYDENVKLNEIAFDSGYEFKSGKKMKKSESLVYGKGNYLMPKNAIFAYNRAESIQTENEKQSELVFNSQYSAYSSFLSDNATILLGTHRDIVRMQTREEKGKVSDVIIQPLLNWTDLVQFAFLCKSQDLTRKKYAEKFALYLLDEKNQKNVEMIGMFPILEIKETTYKGIMLDIIHENFSDCELKMVFD